MQFNVGDVVVHPAHGVGRIVKLEEKRLFGAEARLYYELSTAKSTVWVPVEGNLTAALRPVTSKNALAHYRNLLKSRSAALDKDHRQRNLELNARLKDGSFQAVCAVIRDLTAHGWKTPLNDGDAALLRKTRENCYQEWAAAAGVQVTQASQEIEALLAEARQKYS